MEAKEVLQRGYMVKLIEDGMISMRILVLSNDGEKLAWNVRNQPHYSQENTVAISSVKKLSVGQSSSEFTRMLQFSPNCAHYASLSLTIVTAESAVDIIFFEAEHLLAICRFILSTNSSTKVVGDKLYKKLLKEEKDSIKEKKKKKDKVFGVPLHSGEDEVRIPHILYELITYLEEEGIENVGLFRISGNNEDVMYLKKLYDEGKPVNLRGFGVPEAAALLKLFFRELPVPLLTFEFYDCFVAVSTINEDNARYNQIRKLVRFLNPTHRAVLQYLIRFLWRVSLYHETNKMDANNLAIVFAPNLLKSMDDGINVVVEDMSHSTNIISTLITDYEKIFHGDIG